MKKFGSQIHEVPFNVELEGQMEMQEEPFQVVPTGQEMQLLFEKKKLVRHWHAVPFQAELALHCWQLPPIIKVFVGQAQALPFQTIPEVQAEQTPLIRLKLEMHWHAVPFQAELALHCWQLPPIIKVFVGQAQAVPFQTIPEVQAEQTPLIK
jgi:hypothetical protein